MTDPTIDEFNSDLADLVTSALWSQAPPTSIAAALVRATYAIVVGAGLDFDQVMDDLEVMVIEMNGRSHLH